METRKSRSRTMLILCYRSEGERRKFQEGGEG